MHKLEFRVMPSSTTGSWDVMSREIPTSANRTPEWSLMTVARDATELGEAILEEAEFSTAAHVHRVDGPVGCHHCRELTK